MKKRRRRLDHYDKKIIHYLGKKGEANTNQVAETVGISWLTAKKHLKKLHEMGYIYAVKQGEIIYWELDY